MPRSETVGDYIMLTRILQSLEIMPNIGEKQWLVISA